MERGGFIFTNRSNPKYSSLFLYHFMACEIFLALGFFPAGFGGPWAVVGGRAVPKALLSQGQGRAVPTCCLCSCPPQVDPYLPYEYTCEGMLERIHAYIQNQVGENPCPPWGAISVLVANFPSSPWGTSLLSHGCCAAGALIAESSRRWGWGRFVVDQRC